jgi:hypothetical protein
MSVKIWVIVGYSHDYGECQEWTVGGYFSAAAAREHADLAQIEADRIRKARPSAFGHAEVGDNKYDPKSATSYNSDTNYYVRTVEILDAIPGVD